jgi:ABC-2 type transport system permease protein
MLLAMALSVAGFLASGAGIGNWGISVLIWTFTVAAYGLFWLGLATLLNSRGWSSATNAITLAGVWLVLVAIVPSVINVAISAIHPLPSRIALVEAARDAQNRALIRISNSIDPIDMDQRARGSLMQIMEAEREVQPVLRRFDEQLAKQQEQVRRWRLLSPAIMTQLALTGIADTDGDRYTRFVDATEEFRRKWRAFLSPVYARRFTSADVDRIPKFSFDETVPAKVSVETPLVLLLIYSISMMWAVRFLKKLI